MLRKYLNEKYNIIIIIKYRIIIVKYNKIRKLINIIIIKYNKIRRLIIIIIRKNYKIRNFVIIIIIKINLIFILYLFYI